MSKQNHITAYYHKTIENLLNTDMIKREIKKLEKDIKSLERSVMSWEIPYDIAEPRLIQMEKELISLKDKWQKQKTS